MSFELVNCHDDIMFLGLVNIEVDLDVFKVVGSFLRFWWRKNRFLYLFDVFLYPFLRGFPDFVDRLFLTVIYFNGFAERWTPIHSILERGLSVTS